MNTDFHRFLKTILLLSVFIGVHRWLIPDCLAETDPHFQKRWLTAQFFAEGANAGDFNHDGKPDVIEGPYIYDGPDFTIKHAFMEPHAYDPLAYSQNMFAFAHDFNGDGWDDILEKNGWWEQPEKLDGDPVWKKHQFEFSKPGSAQMYAYDVDGDGDNDVIISLAAHGYGLAWYENIKDKNGDITFKQHLILSP